MILDWVIYGLIIWGLASVLNKTVFKNTSASRGAAWGLTLLVFFINVIALSAAKALRFQAVSQEIGVAITPNSPLDMGGAVAFSYIFFMLLNRRKSSE